MILCLMALLAVVLPAQTPTPYDCQLSATFSASTLTTASYYNRGPAAPCVSWRLTYHTQSATGVSISLQGTGNLANGQADPAGWTNLTVQTGSANPATGTSAGTVAACCDYYPWIRAIATTFTGTGQTMKLAVFGYKGTSAARTTGGGGGGTVTSVTATSPIQATSGNAPVISLDKTKVAQKFFGTAAPGSVATNLPGDLFTDTTAHNEYVCNAPAGTVAPACTSVTAAGWLQINGGGGGTGNVVGPASSTAGHLATFADATGKLIQDGGAPAVPFGSCNFAPTISFGSVYQNTGSQSLFLTVSFFMSNHSGTEVDAYVGSTNTPANEVSYVQMASSGSSSSNAIPIALMIPPSYYFKFVLASGTASVENAYSCISTGIGGGASGGLILIEQHTASNSPELDFTTCITSSYDSYVLVLSHVENATAAQPMLFQASTNGGSTYDSTSSYQWSNVQVLSNGLAVNNVAFPSTYILLGPSQQDNSPEWGGLSGTFQLPGMSSNMGYVSLTGQTVAKDVRDSEANLRNLGGQYKSTTLVNAFRLIAGSGNISSGTARCYAYAQ